MSENLAGAAVLERTEEALASVLATFAKYQSRELEIWWSRNVDFRRPKLQELADKFRITRARAHQIESDMSRKVRPSMEKLSVGPVGAVAAELREKLGLAYPVSNLHWSELGVDGDVGAKQESLAEDMGRRSLGKLLLHVAGPYTLDGQWLLRCDADAFECVRHAVYELGKDGVASITTVTEAIERAGVSPAVSAAVIRSTIGVKVLGQSVCQWPSDAIGRIEIVIRAEGKPMSKAEIARRVEKQFGTVGNALSDSELFTRVDVDRYGLTEWGSEPYESVVEQMKAAIKRRGGVATVEELVADVTGQFSVSPSSVRAYLVTHQFAKVGRGRYRIRGSSEKVTPETRATLEDTAACFKIDSRWALRLEHDAERLRGSGVGIPYAYAHHVGVNPGGQLEVRVVAGRNRQELGQVRFGWPQNMPTVGSVANIAAQLGMKLGDYLFLAWDPVNRRVLAYSTRFVVADAPDEATIRSLIGSLVGLSSLPSTTPKLLGKLAEGLGLDHEAGRGPVIARLNSRGDRKLIKLSRTLYDLQAFRMDADNNV